MMVILKTHSITSNYDNEWLSDWNWMILAKWRERERFPTTKKSFWKRRMMIVSFNPNLRDRFFSEKKEKLFSKSINFRCRCCWMNEWMILFSSFVCLFVCLILTFPPHMGNTYISYRLNCSFSIGSFFLFREREREKKVSLKRPMNLQLACSWLKKKKRAHLCAHTCYIFCLFRLFSKITDRPIILCLKMLFKLPKKMFNRLNLVEERRGKVKYENERESFSSEKKKSFSDRHDNELMAKKFLFSFRLF